MTRHEELQRTNGLLTAQLGAVTSERDHLRSRLNAARSRIDVLLQRLPREPVDDDGGALDATKLDGSGGVPLRSVG